MGEWEQGATRVRQQREAEQSRRLALIVECTTNMVVVTDRERRIKWVNPAYTRVTGWTLAEVQGRTPRSFLHGPKTSLTEASRIGSLLRRGESVQDAELLNYKKSGEPYWVSLRIDPVLDAAGEVIEYVSIQTDITERKRREMDTARLLRLLREAQRLARLGNMEHDIQTGQVLCSDEIFRILDARQGEMDTSYESLMACTHPDDLPEVRRDYEEAIGGGWPFESEHRVVSKAGQVKWVHMRGVLERREDGSPVICRLAVQDVTERKHAEQLQRDKAASEQVARTQREVLARVGHEIRTPLHAILGFADLFERGEGQQLAPDGRRQLGLVRSAARHLLSIANDMMDLRAMQEGRIAMAIRSVAVADVAAEAAGMLQALAAANGLALDVQRLPNRCWCVRTASACAGAHQPDRQCDQIQPPRRKRARHMRSGRAACPCERGRYGHRHRAGPPAALVRALLSRRRGGCATSGRGQQRPGTGHREEPDGGHGRRHRRQQRTRTGKHLQADAEARRHSGAPAHRATSALASRERRRVPAHSPALHRG